MIYDISLQTAGMVVGVLLLISHAAGLINVPAAMGFAKKFPRSRVASTILISMAAIWSFLLVRDMDLGEFSRLRQVILMGIVAGGVLSWAFVEEFLAVRALGMILLLAADPLLSSAILREEPSRLVLVILAYGWVIAGLFFVGMPYLLRDAINFLSATPTRWRMACVGGVVYGLALLVCGFFW
jgi:hypothetical protein